MLRERAPALAVASSLLLSLVLSGCIVPVPHSTRTKGASGEEAKQRIDLHFLVPGLTTRAEVLERLALINTGIKDDRLFVGRWTSTQTEVVMMGMTTDSDLRSAWRARNLIVEFDGQGVVLRQEIVPDRLLLRELGRLALQQQSPDWSKPLEVSVKHYHRYASVHPARLELAKGEFTFEEPEDPSHNFRTSPANIASVFPGLSSDQEGAAATGSVAPDPTYAYYTIHFHEKGNKKVWKSLSVYMDVPSSLIFVQYLQNNSFEFLR